VARHVYSGVMRVVQWLLRRGAPVLPAVAAMAMLLVWAAPPCAAWPVAPWPPGHGGTKHVLERDNARMVSPPAALLNLPTMVKKLYAEGTGFAPNVAWTLPGPSRTAGGGCTDCRLVRTPVESPAGDADAIGEALLTPTLALVSEYEVLTPHWSRFSNVCYHYTNSSRPVLLFLHNGTAHGHAYAEHVAANASEREWPNHIVALDASVAPASDIRVDWVRGWWYHVDNEVSNIAHMFQFHACDLAGLLSHAHRAWARVPPGRGFNGILVSRVSLRTNSVLGWTQLQLLMLVESVAAQPEQRGQPLHIDDYPILRAAGDTTPSSYLARVRCYEHVVVQRGCGPHALQHDLFPSGTAQALQDYRATLFRTLRLDPARPLPCRPSVLVYGRADQPMRRLLNVDELVAALKEALPALNVTVLTRMPSSVFEQARLFNGVDVHITVHSASIYNSIFLPDGAVLFEVGMRTWWGRAMGRFLAEGAILVYELVTAVMMVTTQTRQDTHANNLNVPDVRLLPEGITQIVDTLRARFPPRIDCLASGAAVPSPMSASIISAAVSDMAAAQGGPANRGPSPATRPGVDVEDYVVYADTTSTSLSTTALSVTLRDAPWIPWLPMVLVSLVILGYFGTRTVRIRRTWQCLA
jgi:hypothetical protein